jgi:hypothetical protein
LQEFVDGRGLPAGGKWPALIFLAQSRLWA